MSSNSIYPHTPYFYVIEHVASGKRYAGCRYAKGCNPVEFMTEGGYCTSSKLVKKIIEEEGLESFNIVEIKTVDEVGNVYDYETEFLTENDCAKSDLWLNQHNNACMTFGTEEFKSAMLAKHSVENPMQSEEYKRKHRQTMLKNHRVENPMQSKVIKEQKRQTMLKNHGVEHALQSEKVQEKSRQTCLKNHEVENPSQSEKVREKRRQTILKNHGVMHALQSKEILEQKRQTMLKNHGVENPMQSEEFKEKSRQTMLKNYGVEHPGQTKESRERTIKLNYERLDFGVRTEILNGDFSRFVYLYDTVEHVFLMGVERSLNRGLETKRYIKIGTNTRGYKMYIDVLTMKTYRIELAKFATGLPDNFSIC
jgi:hypothetical protein